MSAPNAACQRMLRSPFLRQDQPSDSVHLPGVRNGGWLSTVTLISFGEEVMATGGKRVQFLQAPPTYVRQQVQLPHRSSITSFILSLSFV